MSNSFDDRHNELYSEWGEKDAYFTFPRWLVEQKKKDEQRIQQLASERDALVEAAQRVLSRAYKLGRMDNIWVQDVLEPVLLKENDNG